LKVARTRPVQQPGFGVNLSFCYFEMATMKATAGCLRCQHEALINYMKTHKYVRLNVGTKTAVHIACHKSPKGEEMRSYKSAAIVLAIGLEQLATPAFAETKISRLDKGKIAMGIITHSRVALGVGKILKDWLPTIGTYAASTVLLHAAGVSVPDSESLAVIPALAPFAHDLSHWARGEPTIANSAINTARSIKQNWDRNFEQGIEKYLKPSK
jgi:hypothetical protein